MYVYGNLEKLRSIKFHLENILLFKLYLNLLKNKGLYIRDLNETFTDGNILQKKVIQSFDT